MTRDELANLIKDLPADIEFVVASDEEGNSYRFAHAMFTTMCNQDGELIECADDDIAAGEYEGWEDDMFPAILFW